MALVAHFKLDNNANDSINTYATTVVGMSYTNEGKIDSAGIFNGTSSYIRMSSSIALNSNADWTVSAWVKTTSSAEQTILSNYDSGPVVGMLSIESGKISYRHYNAAWYTKQGISNVADGNWHLLVWRNYANKTIDLIVDGTIEAASVDSSIQQTNWLNQIGKNWSTSYMNGNMDDLRIYNNLLTDNQIRRLSMKSKGLIAYYKLDGDLTDSSGNNYTLTNFGATINSSGKWNQCYDFTATSSQYMTGPTCQNLYISNSPFTISFWVYIKTWPSASCGLVGFNKYYTETEGGGFGIMINSVNIVFVISDKINTSEIGYAKSNFPINTWLHLSMKFDGQRVYHYLNGNLLGSVARTLWRANNVALTFSLGTQGGWGNYSDIRLDDIKLYDYALPDILIQKLANPGGDLVAWYKFDSDVNDSSGNGFNGTPYNFSHVLGKINYCGSFSTSYVSVANNSALDLLNAGTLSLWAKSNRAFPSDDASYQFRGLISKATGGGAGQQQYFIDWYGTNAFGNLRMGVGNSTTGITLETSQNSLTDWHHIAATWDGSILKLYVDGILRNSTVQTIALSSLSTPLEIGRAFSGSGYSWDGLLDDVKIYNRALLPEEIKSISQAKILHFDFDDNSLSTTNYIYHQNPRVDSTYTTYSITTAGTWLDKHPDAIRVYNNNNSEITGYVNTGVTDWTNTYHAIWTFDNELNKPVVIMRDVDANWKAKYLDIGQSMTSMGLTTGMKYTVSWLQWVSDLNKWANVGVYGQNPSGAYNFYDGLSSGSTTSKNTKINTWQRVYHTFTVSSSWNFTFNLNLYMYGHYNVRGTLKIADVQLEVKDYPTAFANSLTRDSIVIDKSKYGYDGTMPATNTLNSTTDSKLGRRALDFNYVSTDYIDVTNKAYGDVNKITLSAWVKSNDITKAQNIISRNPPYFMRITGSTLRAAIYTGSWVSANGTIPLQSNTWYHLVVTYDGANMKGYVNGVLDINSAKTGDFTGYANLRIGYTTGGEDAPFDGIIDDVRIYATALSAADVLELYNEKSKKLLLDTTTSTLSLDSSTTSMALKING